MCPVKLRLSSPCPLVIWSEVILDHGWNALLVCELYVCRERYSYISCCIAATTFIVVDDTAVAEARSSPKSSFISCHIARRLTQRRRQSVPSAKTHANGEMVVPSKICAMIVRSIVICAVVLAFNVGVEGFAPLRSRALFVKVRPLTTSSSSSTDSDVDEWVSLANGVKKRTLEPGKGGFAQAGSEVEVAFTGTLYGEQDWTVDDVVECWLSNLQGLDHLMDEFVVAGIDGSKLMGIDVFTEEFVVSELKVSNKIQRKKLLPSV